MISIERVCECARVNTDILTRRPRVSRVAPAARADAHATRDARRAIIFAAITRWRLRHAYIFLLSRRAITYYMKSHYRHDTRFSFRRHD